MAQIICMPRLSDTMTDGVVSKWYKKLGETIKEGDIIADIETDKATQEFESEYNGVLLHIGAKEGDSLAVDSLIAIIGEKNEDITSLISIPTINKENTTENPKEILDTKKELAAKELLLPNNAFVVTMPRLSDTMSEGKVQKWYKKIGEAVKEGEILADIETDKAIQEFESEFSGTLLFIGATERETIEVDKILAVIGEPGTDISMLLSNENPISNTVVLEKEAATLNKTDKEETTSAAIQSKPKTERIFISPLAKKISLEKGIDVHKVIGSGDGGRIILKDIENFKLAEKGNLIQSLIITDSPDTEIPLSAIKKVAAKRLAESKFTAPHYYLNMELDMEGVIKMREEINKSIAPNKISFNDILIKFVAMTIKKHPEVNVTWAEDKIIQHHNINIGVAVAIDEGLLVPVINHANQKSFEVISAEMKDKATRARERKIKAEELSGSTFSISNLGSYGIDSFTSIINQPNACILSIGAIIQKPVVKNNQIVIGNTMKITLACDHRTVDGTTGSKFLQALKNYIETPVLLFL